MRCDDRSIPAVESAECRSFTLIVRHRLCHPSHLRECTSRVGCARCYRDDVIAPRQFASSFTLLLSCNHLRSTSVIIIIMSASSSPYTPPVKRHRADVLILDVCNIAPSRTVGVRRIERLIDSGDYRDSAAHSSLVSSHTDPRSLSVVVAKQGVCIELIMQYLPVSDIMALAQTSRSMLLIAAHKPLAWKHVGQQIVRIAHHSRLSPVYAKYHPVLMRMFPVTLVPDAMPSISKADYYSGDRIVDLLQSMRVTTIVLTQSAHTWLCTDYRATRLLLVLAMVDTLIVHVDNKSCNMHEHVIDIIERSPRLAHIILESHDLAIPMTLASVMREKVGIKSLKIDTTRAIHDVNSAFFVMSSKRLHQSLTHLTIGAQWNSDSTAYIVAELSRFERLRSLRLDRTAAFPWPHPHVILGPVSIALPVSLTELTCDVYYCACTKRRMSLLSIAAMKAAAENVRLIAVQGVNLSSIVIKLIGCESAIRKPGVRSTIEKVMRKAIGDIGAATITFSLVPLDHADSESFKMEWSASHELV